MSILDEIDMALDALNHAPSAHHNVEKLVEEAYEVFQTDPIMNTHFALALGMLRSVKLDGIRKGEASARVHLKNQSHVLRHILLNYHKVLIQSLLIALRGDVKLKNKLLLLTERLASHLTRMGYSMSYLSKLFETQACTPELLADRVETALQSLPIKTREFMCMCRVKWPNHNLDFTGTDLAFAPQNSSAFATPAGMEFQAQDREAHTLRVNVQALDPFSARAQAFDTTTQLNGAFRLYLPSRKRQIKIYPGVLIQDNLQFFYIGSDETRLGHVRDAKKPERGVADILRLKASGYQDYAVLLGSLQYHLLYVQSETDESRLVNLWIALESLLPRHGRSILEAIVDTVPVSLSSCYLRQLCLKICEDLKALLRCNPERALPIWMAHSTAERINPHDLVYGLADAKDGPRITSLLALCEGHFLLKNRLFSLWDQIFQKPSITEKRLEQHKLHVEWQLRRIYRARNYVMHTGCSDAGIRHLIQNLHTYYIDFMHNLLADLRFHAFNTTDAALTYRACAHNHLLSRLRNSQGKTDPPINTAELLQLRFDTPDDNYPVLWSTAGYEKAPSQL